MVIAKCASEQHLILRFLASVFLVLTRLPNTTARIVLRYTPPFVSPIAGVATKYAALLAVVCYMELLTQVEGISESRTHQTRKKEAC